MTVLLHLVLLFTLLLSFSLGMLCLFFVFLSPGERPKDDGNRKAAPKRPPPPRPAPVRPKAPIKDPPLAYRDEEVLINSRPVEESLSSEADSALDDFDPLLKTNKKPKPQRPAPPRRPAPPVKPVEVPKASAAVQSQTKPKPKVEVIHPLAKKGKQVHIFTKLEAVTLTFAYSSKS